MGVEVALQKIYWERHERRQGEEEDQAGEALTESQQSSGIPGGAPGQRAHEGAGLWAATPALGLTSGSILGRGHPEKSRTLA